MCSEREALAAGAVAVKFFADTSIIYNLYRDVIRDLGF